MRKNHLAHTRKRSVFGSAFVLLAAGAAIAGAGSAGAQAFAPHAYIGGAYGATNAQGDFNGQVANAATQGLTGGSALSNIRSDRSDNGGKLFAGYQFHRNLAAELSYVDFGRFNGGCLFSGPNCHEVRSTPRQMKET